MVAGLPGALTSVAIFSHMVFPSIVTEEDGDEEEELKKYTVVQYCKFKNK